MKKVLILTVFAIFMVSCKGSIVQLTAVPDFGDGENNQSDDDSPLTDDDSPITDDDSPVTDHDSPVTDHDSPVTDDDSPLTDHDSPVTDEDEVPDEIGGDCTTGDKKCDTNNT
ncbi:MAG TPA: hypothetical protein PLX56_06655, partial [bacterium]|nr:hypothetical protein [bacterium]